MIRNLIIAQCLDSTNESIKNYKPDTALIAVKQTQGRGRQGKSWNSPEGGLYLSYKKTFQKDIPKSLIPILIGVSCHKALSSIENKKLFLKWPNDILNESSQKISGILIEGNKDCFIAGIGVNCFNSDSNDFSKIESQLSPLWVAKLILERIEAELKDFSAKKIIEYWERNSYTKKGDLIEAQRPNGNRLKGTISHLGQNGELWVKLNDEINLTALISEEIKQVRKSSQQI